MKSSWVRGLIGTAMRRIQISPRSSGAFTTHPPSRLARQRRIDEADALFRELEQRSAAGEVDLTPDRYCAARATFSICSSGTSRRADAVSPSMTGCG